MVLGVIRSNVSITHPSLIPSALEVSDIGRRRLQRKGKLTKKSGSWFLRWREYALDGTAVQRSQVIAPAVGPDALNKAALDWADACVLVLPCGRSAHLEAGYCAGQGKVTIFYLHPDKFEPELMYLLGNGCVATTAALLAAVELRAQEANA